MVMGARCRDSTSAPRGPRQAEFLMHTLPRSRVAQEGQNDFARLRRFIDIGNAPARAFDKRSLQRCRVDMAVGKNSGAGRIAGEIERGACYRDDAVTKICGFCSEESVLPVAGVADDSQRIDASQVVTVLVPGRKAP